MNVFKNIVGFLAYVVINIGPWLIFIIGVFSRDVFLLCTGGLLIIINKLRSIEDLLLSISNALVVLLRPMLKDDYGEDISEEENKINKSMFR